MRRRAQSTSLVSRAPIVLRRAIGGVAALIAMAAALLAWRAQPASAVRTTILPPAAGGEAFEPTVALDPANPSRILAAAMYGVPFGRGATGIWMWRSGDGGRSWSSRRLSPPRFPGVDAEPNSAADVVAGFARDGTPIVATMAGLLPLGGPQRGIFFSRTTADSARGTSLPMYLNSIDSAAARRVIYDKPWMVVDHGERSAYRGSIYLSGSAITTGSGPAGMGVRWSALATTLELRVSRDSGRSFAPGVVVADSAFGGYLAIGAAGTLDVTYLRLKNTEGGGDAAFHRRSTDGGKTFEPAVAVATMKGDTLLELPSLGARPNGDLLACWSQGVRSAEQTNQVRCAARAGGGSWSEPRLVTGGIPSGVVPAFPAVVGTERGWYMLLYLVGQSRTEVALFFSPDGAAFSKLATLASMDGLGIDRMCVSSATACRRTRQDAFVIGDYVTLDARGGRIAAAYILPRGKTPPHQAAVYVSTLTEPSR